MKLASNMVLKSLGIWLFLAAYAKGWCLLTEPFVDNHIWTHRPFELVLSIWLLSGKFKKVSWLAALLCFSVFSVVTLYKVISGAECFGYFGSLYVDPWITLFVIDLPAVMLLSVFRPRRERQIDSQSVLRFSKAALIALVILSVCAPVLGSSTIMSSIKYMNWKPGLVNNRHLLKYNHPEYMRDKRY